MDLHAELARFNPDPALQEWLSGALEQLTEKSRQDAAAIKAANLKIQALTLELAHLRRMRFTEVLRREERGA